MVQLFDEASLIEEDAKKFKTVRHKHINYLSDDEKEKAREKTTAPQNDGLLSLFGWFF